MKRINIFENKSVFRKFQHLVPLRATGRRCRLAASTRAPNWLLNSQRSTSVPRRRSLWPATCRLTSAHGPPSTARPSAGCAARTTRTSTWTWTPWPSTARPTTCEHTHTQQYMYTHTHKRTHIRAPEHRSMSLQHIESNEKEIKSEGIIEMTREVGSMFLPLISLFPSLPACLFLFSVFPPEESYFVLFCFCIFGLPAQSCVYRCRWARCTLKNNVFMQ